MTQAAGSCIGRSLPVIGRVSPAKHTKILGESYARGRL
jgi:hypothetical protein